MFLDQIKQPTDRSEHSSIRALGMACLTGIVLLSSSGCAHTLGKMGSNDASLPKELPKDFQDKFEVKDENAPRTVPVTPPVVQVEVPKPVAVKSSSKQKKKKNRLSGAPLASSTPFNDVAKDAVKGAAKNPKPAKVAGPASAETDLPKTVSSPIVYDPSSASAKNGAPRASDEAPPVTYPVRRPAKDPIWLGEQQVFEITYFGMPAADFTLDVLPYKQINNRKVYHIRGTAVSSKVFSLFYKLNDTVETYIDYEGIFSHRFQVQLDETKQTRNALELNDSEKGRTFYWNRWKHVEKNYVETKAFFPMPPFAQDSLSALFYLRTVPLKTGAVFEFPVVSEGHGWDAVMTVVRREILDSPMGPIKTVVLKPETKYQGILQKRGDSFIWLTDDDRRLLVRLEAKVKIGTVVARLKHFETGTPPATTEK